MKNNINLINDAPLCNICKKKMVLVKEYAKDHFSYFCKDCKEWRYIP
jgi:hypothetical protein